MSKSSISRKDFFKLVGGAIGIGGLSYVLGAQSQPSAVSTNEAPAYIDENSSFPVFRGPFLHKDAQLAAFLFQADLNALTELCNQTLNRVPNSPFEYVPLAPKLFVIYADMLVASLDERDSKIGLFPETEVGFWLPLIAMQRTTAGPIPHHLAWHIPYLFVDEGNAIATGREMYGFNKQAATFIKTPDIQTPQFSSDVLGFQQFAPDAIAQKERLLEVSSSSTQSSSSQWDDWETAKIKIFEILEPQVRRDLGEEVVAFAARTALQNAQLVFLKQFRQSTNPQKADYQTVIEAPLELKNFQGGGFFSQPPELNLHSLESHPLARMLGLKEHQTAEAGAWLKLSFTLGLGTKYQV